MQHRLPAHVQHQLARPALFARYSHEHSPLRRMQRTESCSSICAAPQGSSASKHASLLQILHICKGAHQLSLTPTHARRTPSWLGYGRVRVEGEAGEMSESAEHAGEGVECVGWLTGHAHLSWLLRVQHEQQCDLALRLPWRASRDPNLSTHPHRRFNSGRVGPISAARGEVSRSRHSNARHRQRYPKGFQGSPGLQKTFVLC